MTGYYLHRMRPLFSFFSSRRIGTQVPVGDTTLWEEIKWDVMRQNELYGDMMRHVAWYAVISIPNIIMCEEPSSSIHWLLGSPYLWRNIPRYVRASLLLSLSLSPSLWWTLFTKKLPSKTFFAGTFFSIITFIDEEQCLAKILDCWGMFCAHSMARDK